MNPEIKRIDFDTHDFANAQTHGNIVFVFACGYEARSIDLLKRIGAKVPPSRLRIFAATFTTFTDACCKAENDAFIKSKNIAAKAYNPKNSSRLIEDLDLFLKACLEDGDIHEVHIDYSSMSRNWYCGIVKHFLCGPGAVFPVYGWYSAATYGGSKYPCVGYGEFNVFSGQPSITATHETHIFGLGFDGTRSHGIWNYLDPDRTVVLIGDAGDEEKFEKVANENSEIIAAAELVVRCQLFDFPGMVADVVDLARKFGSNGDVALVPDGPKPLTLAMSLAPEYFDGGVYCWHVSHVKPEDYAPVNAVGIAAIYGFKIE